MNSCIDACYQYNVHTVNADCAGVTYNANLTSAVAETNGNNCFLKSGVGSYVHGGDLSESAMLDEGSQ